MSKKIPKTGHTNDKPKPKVIALPPSRRVRPSVMKPPTPKPPIPKRRPKK